MATPPPLPPRKPSREMILVPKDELEAITERVRALHDRLAEEAEKAVSQKIAERAEAALLLMRCEALAKMPRHDPDKTPTRPPSADDMRKAYSTSSEFRPPVDLTPRSGRTMPGPFKIEKVEHSVREPQGHRLGKKPPIPRED